MRSYIFSTLALAAAVSAQNSTAVLLNPFLDMETVTAIAADSTATTYTKSCSGDGRIPDSATSGPAGYITCEPLALTQGPSVWELHQTGLGPDPAACDMKCKFGEGGYEKADATCTMSFSGIYTSLGFPESSTETVLGPSNWASGMQGDAKQTVAVINAISSSSNPSITSAPGKPPGATTPGASSAGAAAPSANSTSPTKSSTGNTLAAYYKIDILAFIGGATSILAASILLKPLIHVSECSVGCALFLCFDSMDRILISKKWTSF
ncbi:unnamed protein product [Periconia digitata]|uniref:Uncharacterized protein n=1 Tax=Periconia digitata TaxID=1303443 RepID=A0A9W4XWL7_9PLEO|nr:unnamed protein product [Periconia digitata]